MLPAEIPLQSVRRIRQESGNPNHRRQRCISCRKPGRIDYARLVDTVCPLLEYKAERVVMFNVQLRCRKDTVMTNYLQELVDAARRVPFPNDAREAQRRSFAYGNTRIENERITRQMVDEQAEVLKQANQSK